MEVRLLGPLELVEGGREIQCRGPRQRGVLALLALHANQVVSVSRLLDELWGDEESARATNDLQVGVWRLRRVLPRGRLVTKAPGYLLRITPDELDITRFERLLASGRDALASAAADEAARTLRQALELWRGAALADFRYEPFAQAEIVRLEELRLVCLEERIEADLAGGAAGEMVGELHHLVADQPLRERLHRQLMLALYRSGRQAEALEVYRKLRSLLADELGLEPTPLLRELEAAILRHDPTLEVAAARSPTAPTPVRKPVTVLCAELKAAQKSGAGLDPERLRQVLEDALTTLTVSMERYGGTLAGVAGGRVLGAFGVRALHEDDALRAAEATLASRNALVAEAAAPEWHPDQRLIVRFGLATGEVLVGGPDPPGFAGAAVAHAVELAESAGPGEILISEATRRLAAAALEVEPLGHGRFRLLAARMGARSLPVRLDAPIVGRDQELARLSAAFARVEDERSPEMVTVLGEAGLGKTRLAHELAVRLAERVAVLIGRCLPYGEGITFWPLRELVRQAGAGEGTREDLEGLLQGEADASVVAEWLAGAVGPSGQGALVPAEIFWATRRLLETLARRRPLLVVLEDLHWAEPTFLDLVESLAVQAAKAPLLLLGLARPELLEQRPAWTARTAEAIWLEPLADHDATTLLDALIGVSAPPASAYKRILQAAAGNPFYLEQLVASLWEEHSTEDGPPLPPTIRALLAARLDQLGPGERAVLECAAILGKDFFLQAVAELLPVDARIPLRRHVQALIAKTLVQPQPSQSPGGENFTFRHILIQQAAYRAIPKSLRADLHEHYADWLDRLTEKRASEHDETLGYHLEQAARYRGELAPFDRQATILAQRASTYLEAAGESAHTRGDALAAVNLLERAASLLPPDDPALARILTGLGAALTEAGELARAAAALETAQQVATSAADECLRVHAHVERLMLGLQVDLQHVTPEVSRALPHVVRVFKRHGDELGLCQARRLQAAVCWNQARSAAAEKAWQRAAVHARRAGDQRQLVILQGWLASAALWGPTSAAEGIRRCQTYLDEVGDHPTGQAVILRHQAGLYAMQDQLKEALRLLRRSRAILDDFPGTMTAAITEPAAFIAMLTSNPRHAERNLRRDYERLAGMGEKEHLATTAALLAQAITAQGPDRYDEAERLIAVSQQASAGEDTSAQIVGQGVLARILAARQHLPKAEELARAAVTLADQTDFLNQHGDALLDLAEVLDAAGREQEAHQVVGQALDLYQRKGNIRGTEKARRRLKRYDHA